MRRVVARRRSARRASRAGRCSRDRARSQPEISSGVARSRISARPLIPTPPAPTKWRRRRRRNLTGAGLSPRKGSSARSPRGVGPAPAARAFCPIGDEPVAVCQELGERPPARLSAVRSFSSITTAAPARVERPRVLELVAGAPRPRSGTRIAGRPAAASSATVMRARAADDQVAHAICLAELRQERLEPSSPAGIARVALPRRRSRSFSPVWWTTSRPRLLEQHGAASAIGAVDDRASPGCRRRRARAASSPRGIERRDLEELAAHRSAGDDARPRADARWPPRGRRPCASRTRFRNRLATPGQRVRLVDRASESRATAPPAATGTVDVAADARRPRARASRFSSAPRLEERRAAAVASDAICLPSVLPTKPEAATSSSGKPAAGTSRVSRPCAVPTKTIARARAPRADLVGERDAREDVPARSAGRDHVGAELAPLRHRTAAVGSRLRSLDLVLRDVQDESRRRSTRRRARSRRTTRTAAGSPWSAPARARRDRLIAAWTTIMAVAPAARNAREGVRRAARGAQAPPGDDAEARDERRRRRGSRAPRRRSRR